MNDLTALLIVLFITFIVPPLVFCPLLLFDGYILPQITLTAVGIGIALVFLLCEGIFAYNWVVLVAIFYFVYLMLSNVWSTCPQSSSKDVPLVFSHLVGFVLLFTVLTQVESAIVWVALGVTVPTLLCSVYGILQSTGRDPLFPERIISKADEYAGKTDYEIPPFFNNKQFVDRRAISTLGNTNFAAGYFIVGLPFVIMLAVLVHWSLLFIAVPVVWAVLSTKSRAGVLALLVGVYWFIAAIDGTKGWSIDYLLSRSELFLCLLQLVVAATACLLFYRYKDMLLRIKRSLSADTRLNTMLDISGTDRDHPVAHLRYRFRYWSAAWWLIKKKPILGYGLRTYRKEVYRAQAELNKLDKGKFLGPDYLTPQPRECHNDVIENFVEGGGIGGLLFIVIVLAALYHGMITFDDAEGSVSLVSGLLVCGVLSSLVNAFFFFPLRLGPSGLCFWAQLAAIEALHAKHFGMVAAVNFQIHPLLILLVAVLLGAMLWECLMKQNIGNYYFLRHSMSNDVVKREKHLNKSVEWCPRDNIFRTHMLISYLFGFPQVANFQGNVLHQHFDGMVPAWTMAYNCGLAAMCVEDYARAVQMFELSLYYYPSFEPAEQQRRKAWVLAPLPNRGVIMKVPDKNAAAMVRQLIEESNQPGIHPERRRMLELMFICSVLDEKVRLNIPQNWVFNVESCIFLAPNEVGPQHQIMEVGHVKLLIARRRG